jgi:hypothetical protein
MKFFDKLKRDQNEVDAQNEQLETQESTDVAYADPLCDADEPEMPIEMPSAQDSETDEQKPEEGEKLEYTPDQDDIIGDIFAELLADAPGTDKQESESEVDDLDAESEIVAAIARSQEDEAAEDPNISCDNAENAEFIASLFAEVSGKAVEDSEAAVLDGDIEALLAQAIEKDEPDAAINDVATDVDDDVASDKEAAEDDIVLDDEDVLLMTALGYRSANTSDYSKNSAELDSSAPKYTNISRAFAFDGHEYRSKEQEGKIKEAYAKERLIMRIRAAGTLLFAVILFIFDLFGKSFGGFFDPALYPTTHVLMSFQFLLLASALSYKQLWDGLKGIVQADPRPYSMASLTVLLTALYNITLALVGNTGFALYNFPAAFALVICVAYDYMVLEREISVFNKLSSWDGVCGLERLDSASLAAELGEKNIGKNGIGRAFKLSRGATPDNYFHRLNRRNPADKIYNYMIAPVLALALVIFIVSLASNRGFLQAFNIFIILMQIGLPAFIAISAIIPFFAMSTFGLGKNVAVLSEADIADYSEINTVVFDEKDAFGEGSMNMNRISLCDGGKACDVYSVMEDVSAVFNKIGGTFSDSFGAPDESGDPTVNVESVVNRGIKATVGDKSYIIGSDEYLTKCGIAVSGYSDKSFTENIVGGVVIHVALGGVEVIKLYMTYTIDPAFAEMTKQISARGIRTVLRSRDPYIDSELLNDVIGELENPIQVIQNNVASSSDEQACAVDSGILADDMDWGALLKVNDVGENFKKWTRLNSTLGLGFLAAGVLLSAILGALGASVGLSSLYVVLFQLIAILPSAVVSKLLLD